MNMLLQVFIKDSIMFSAQTPGLRKKTYHNKNENLSMKVISLAKTL